MMEGETGRAARRARARAVAFFADSRGAITIFAIVAFTMLLAFIGLVVDVGRVMNVHSQANSYADRVALSAAQELDGRAGALNRAINAAQGANLLVDPGFRLTLSGDSTVGVRRLTFMSEIGPDPADPYAHSGLDNNGATLVAGDVITAYWEPGDPAPNYSAGWDKTSADRESAFVLVDVSPETETYVFAPILASFIPGADLSATVAPQALAGFRRSLCNFPPLFICNIAEATEGAGAAFDPKRGQMIRVKQGKGGSWGPGNFGLIDQGNGGAGVEEGLAKVNPGTKCVDDELLVSKTGATTGQVKFGMNVRMDMYDGDMKQKANSADKAEYAPAPNVLKGIKRSGSCPSNKTSTTSSPFPRDNCFMPSGAFPAGAPGGAGGNPASPKCISYKGEARAGFGHAGDWARYDYWSYNHGSAPVPPGYDSMTRYDAYRYEIEHPEPVNTGDESSIPSCSTAAPTKDRSRDRRVLSIAVVNCGNALQGKTDFGADNVPIVGFLDVFLTEAIDDGWWGATNQDIYVEVLNYVKANAPQSMLREYPVLYR
ncbi:MAG: TadE/TadG family type IV pilus assembly protein [Amphiplicatus sp.]